MALTSPQASRLTAQRTCRTAVRQPLRVVFLVHDGKKGASLSRRPVMLESNKN